MPHSDELLPSLEHSHLLWEEVREKIPNPLVVGVFTVTLRVELDGLGRLKRATEFRGGYSITPRPEKNSPKTLTRGTVDPLVAKKLNLSPAIKLSSLENITSKDSDARSSFQPFEHEIGLKDALGHTSNCEESLKDTWIEMKNSGVVLPELSETTYVLVRHVVDKNHLSQESGVRVTRFFTGIVGTRGGSGEGFTAQYEISKPMAHYNDRSLPVEMLMDTVVRRVPENVQIMLSPQATLTLYYHLRTYSSSLLKKILPRENWVVVSPSSSSACFRTHLDDQGYSFSSPRDLMSPLPKMRAKEFGNPLHDASYELKDTPIHMQFNGHAITDNPSQVILINDIAPITTVFGASKNPVLTGTKCILIKEGELVAQIPFLNFTTPSMQSLIAGMIPTTENFWTSPSALPISGEFPYMLLSKTKILSTA